MSERRLSMTAGRAVVGEIERAIRDACFARGIVASFERSHGFFDPDTRLYVVLHCADGVLLDATVAWLCDPKTWETFE